jgi:hypothetical protein
MIATAPIEDLLGDEGLDPDADSAIAAVLSRAGLSTADYGVVEDEGDGPTMTAAAKLSVEPRAPTALSPEDVTRLTAEHLQTLEERSRTTTDERMLRQIQSEVNEYTLLERIAPYMPKSVPSPVRFGHAESECFRFVTPLVRGVHLGGEHVFWNNIYETTDPVEIGALLRLVAEGYESGDELVVLEPKAEAFKDRYGRLLGWEKPGSANVKRWAKMNMLRTGA